MHCWTPSWHLRIGEPVFGVRKPHTATSFHSSEGEEPWAAIAVFRCLQGPREPRDALWQLPAGPSELQDAVQMWSRIFLLFITWKNTLDIFSGIWLNFRLLFYMWFLVNWLFFDDRVCRGKGYVTVGVRGKRKYPVADIGFHPIFASLHLLSQPLGRHHYSKCALENLPSTYDQLSRNDENLHLKSGVGGRLWEPSLSGWWVNSASACFQEMSPVRWVHVVSKWLALPRWKATPTAASREDAGLVPVIHWLQPQIFCVDQGRTPSHQPSKSHMWLFWPELPLWHLRPLWVVGLQSSKVNFAWGCSISRCFVVKTLCFLG